MKNWIAAIITNNDFLAQMTHVLGASVIVLASRHYGWAWWVGCMLVLAWALPKEFLVDPWLEGDSYLDGLQDFSFYVLGAAVTTGILAVT